MTLVWTKDEWAGFQMNYKQYEGTNNLLFPELVTFDLCRAFVLRFPFCHLWSLMSTSDFFQAFYYGGPKLMKFIVLRR